MDFFDQTYCQIHWQQKRYQNALYTFLWASSDFWGCVCFILFFSFYFTSEQPFWKVAPLTFSADSAFNICYYFFSWIESKGGLAETNNNNDKLLKRTNCSSMWLVTSWSFYNLALNHYLKHDPVHVPANYSKRWIDFRIERRGRQQTLRYIQTFPVHKILLHHIPAKQIPWQHAMEVTRD